MEHSKIPVNYCSSLSPAGFWHGHQDAIAAGGKEPINSLSVEDFIQKTLVISPEVALLANIKLLMK